MQRQTIEGWPRILAEGVAIVASILLDDPRFRVLTEIRYGYKRHLSLEFDAAIEAAEAILLEIENSIN